MIDESDGSPLTVPAINWITRATLDVIGASMIFKSLYLSQSHSLTSTAAFDYEFNSVIDDSNAIANKYETVMLVSKSFFHPTEPIT